MHIPILVAYTMNIAKTCILFVVDDPVSVAGYRYDDAKTENMYININMLMCDCLFNSFLLLCFQFSPHPFRTFFLATIVAVWIFCSPSDNDVHRVGCLTITKKTPPSPPTTTTNRKFIRMGGKTNNNNNINRADTSVGTPSYKTHMKLTIFSVSMADYGMYKCVAKNPRGETDGTIRLYGKFKNKNLLYMMEYACSCTYCGRARSEQIVLVCIYTMHVCRLRQCDFSHSYMCNAFTCV